MATREPTGAEAGQQDNGSAWLEVSVQVDDELVEPVSELVNQYAHGRTAIEQFGGDGDPLGGPATFVRAYLAPGPEQTGALLNIEAGLGHLSQVRPLGEPSVRALREADWAHAWKRHFRVLRIGRRLVIRPSWRRYTARPGDLVITLDPGMAFGTGLHPSTRLCLEALENVVQPGHRFLDLGAGSGILSLAALKLGAACVLALDNDPLAVQAAEQNAVANGLSAAMTVRLGSLADVDGTFEVIAANILAPVILDFLRDGLIERAAAGGRVVVSGILDSQAQAVAQGFQARGASIIARAQERDWVALTAMRNP